MSTRLNKYLSITACLFFFIVIGCTTQHQGFDRLDTFDDENLKKTGNTKGLEKAGWEHHHFGQNGAINVNLSGSSNRAVIYSTVQKPGYNMYSQRAQDHDDDDYDDDNNDDDYYNDYYDDYYYDDDHDDDYDDDDDDYNDYYDDYYDDDYDYGNVLFDDPTDAGRPSPSFQDDILPILTNRCAFAGCHVAGGPYGIDLRTYDAVIAGGYEGPIVIAGNARRSELVEVIVEGEMPPNGPPLPVAQIQLIIDWINEGAKNNSNNETNAASDNPTDTGSPSPSFQDDILPILTNRCAFAGCHVAGGPGGIDLRTYDAVIAGGSKGAIVIAGDAGESELVKQIIAGKMPPSGPPLPAAQIQLIIDWINEGAKNNSNNETEIEPPIPPGDSFPPQDVNRDGVVNILDLVQAALQFGQVGTNLAGDVNGNGTVDVADLILISVNLSENAAAPASPIDDSNPTANYHPSSVKRQFQALAALESLAIPSRGARLAHDLLKAWLSQVKPLVTETKLLPNYPNPFNPETWIPYSLANASYVQISIYDANGHLVRLLALGHQAEGYYTSKSRAAYWDGRDSRGQIVGSGLYFYQLQVGSESFVRKMLILK